MMRQCNCIFQLHKHKSSKTSTHNSTAQKVQTDHRPIDQLQYDTKIQTPTTLFPHSTPHTQKPSTNTKAKPSNNQIIKQPVTPELITSTTHHKQSSIMTTQFNHIHQSSPLALPLSQTSNPSSAFSNGAKTAACAGISELDLSIN
jgi:hypothetical protein